MDASKVDRTKTAQGHALNRGSQCRKRGVELPTSALLGRDITGQNSEITDDVFAVQTRPQAGQDATAEANSSHLDQPAGQQTCLEARLELETSVVECTAEGEPAGQKGNLLKSFLEDEYTNSPALLILLREEGCHKVTLNLFCKPTLHERHRVFSVTSLCYSIVHSGCWSLLVFSVATFFYVFCALILCA